MMRKALLTAGLSDPFVLGLFGGEAWKFQLLSEEATYVFNYQKMRHYLMEAVLIVSSEKRILFSSTSEELCMDTTAISPGFAHCS